MEFGVDIPHHGRLASPGHIREFCPAAEELGFEGLWTVDHVVMPVHTDSYYTLGRRPAPVADWAVSDLLSPNYEMTSTLLWVAGFTSKAWLGTRVAVLPLRNPLLNARMLASLDLYSGGRLLYGVGVGWLKEEAEFMQVPWDRRGERSEEHIALLRTVWTAEGRTVEFAGKYYRFGPMDPEPRPAQRPPPILIGGHSDVALERAGRIGDGWIAATMSASRLVEHWDKVQSAARASGRDPAKLRLVAFTDIAVREGEGPEALAEPMDGVIERLESYRAVGVDHLVLGLLGAPSPKAHLAALQTISDHILPAFR